MSDEPSYETQLRDKAALAAWDNLLACDLVMWGDGVHESIQWRLELCSKAAQEAADAFMAEREWRMNDAQ